jgi:hypothetical protein
MASSTPGWLLLLLPLVLLVLVLLLLLLLLLLLMMMMLLLLLLLFPSNCLLSFHMRPVGVRVNLRARRVLVWQRRHGRLQVLGVEVRVLLADALHQPLERRLAA